MKSGARNCYIVSCFACLLVVISGCQLPAGSSKPLPPPGAHCLVMDRYAQHDKTNYLGGTDYYCFPAALAMWQNFYVGGVNEFSFQDNVWNFAATRGWVGQIFGSNDRGVQFSRADEIAFGMNLYATATRREYYTGNWRVFMGDLGLSIDNRHPAMLQTDNGTHVVLMVGYSWNNIANAQPRVEFIHIHDPSPTHPTWYETNAVPDWLVGRGHDISGTLNAMLNVSIATGASGPHLADFDAMSGTYYGDPAPPPTPPAPLAQNSAIRDCQNYREQEPVFQPSIQACYDHCAANGANACEWEEVTRQCWVEFGDACRVEGGVVGWWAGVMNAPPPPPQPPSGDMQQGFAVRWCSNYSDMGSVQKASAAECLAHCAANGANACEWFENDGGCWVEFGNGCGLESGYGGWWAAILSQPATPRPVAAFTSHVPYRGAPPFARMALSRADSQPKR